MKIFQIPVGTMQNFAYLIADESTKEAAVVDPGFEAEKILQKAEAEHLVIKTILLTHFHYDHAAAADELAGLTGAEIFGHAHALSKRGREEEGKWVVPKVYTALADGQPIKVGHITGRAIATPGHQADHLCYLFDECIFSGDALFIETAGRTDLPDSNAQAMFQTFEFFKSLPDGVMIYPGHDYGSVPSRTIGEEKKYNRFLR